MNITESCVHEYSTSYWLGGKLIKIGTYVHEGGNVFLAGRLDQLNVIPLIK